MKQKSKVFLNYLRDMQFGRTQQNPRHLKANQAFRAYFFIAVPLCRHLLYFQLIQNLSELKNEHRQQLCVFF